MKPKNIILFVCILALLIMAGIVIGRPHPLSAPATTSTSVKFITSTISADGFVTAQNQAKLSFQTSGKLVRLPFKVGDKIFAGQTIAQLDTYTLQRQLTAALNTYRSTRDTFDQNSQNSQNNILNSQLTPTYTKANVDITSTVNDAIKRLVDQNQATLDNSVINVELANYALQLSSLTSPLTGLLTHADVTVPGLNITPAVSFTVADPDSMVFRANIPAGSIYYVTPGSSVTLVIDGLPDKITGTVATVYPSKVVLSNGQTVYQVDITSPDLIQAAKLDQTGRAFISTNSENVALVPAWTVLGGQYIWLDNNGSPELRHIVPGKIHGTEIEVIQGLSSSDKIIVNPQYIPSLKYPIL